MAVVTASPSASSRAGRLRPSPLHAFPVTTLAQPSSTFPDEPQPPPSALAPTSMHGRHEHRRATMFSVKDHLRAHPMPPFPHRRTRHTVAQPERPSAPHSITGADRSTRGRHKLHVPPLPSSPSPRRLSSPPRTTRATGKEAPLLGGPRRSPSAPSIGPYTLAQAPRHQVAARSCPDRRKKKGDT
ncbi:hypothetical protein U9M48_039513 [Paspalum notatum var. saurae]|uniref:Uncharacterized protein n=1 Tax=Paspalum notatum var. saurae TaxID=547442 RepID=A0AAQ3UP37_PASNO